MSYTMNLRFGPSVPEDALNLAWITVPEVSPARNVLLADLASTIPTNEASHTSDTIAGSSYSRQLRAVTGTEHSVTGSLVPNVSCPIHVFPPSADPGDVWRVRLTDGVFKQHVTVRDDDLGWLSSAFEPGTDVVAVYSLIEPRLAPHSASGAYTEMIASERPFPVDTHTLQLAHRDIVQVHAFAINGTEISLYGNPDATLDAVNGTITLSRAVSVADEIFVGYSYSSSEFPYYGFYDTDDLYKDLDLNPAYGHVYNNGEPTANLIGRVVSLFLLPSAAYDARAAAHGVFRIERAWDHGCTSLLRWTSSMLISLPDVPGIIDDGGATRSILRGTYGSALYGTYHFAAHCPTTDYGDDNYTHRNGSVGDIKDFPSAAVLARLYVSSSGTVESLDVVDTRQRGGGVSDDPVARARSLSGEQVLEAGACWDVSGWDGEPAMLNGTVVIELPSSLLLSESNPTGRFTEAQIEGIVRKRIPIGVMPVIRYIEAQ